MDLIQLLQNLKSSIDSLQSQLADAQAAAQAQYDKGFEDGKASVTGGFTQADIDSAVSAAVAPLNEKVAALQAQVDGIQGQLDAQKAALKEQFKALLDAEDADAKAKVDAL